MRLIFCIMFLFFSSCSVVEIVNNGETPFKMSATDDSEVEIETDGELPFYFWAKSPMVHELDLSKEYNGVLYEKPSYSKFEFRPTFMSRFLSITTLGLYNPIPFKIKSYSKRIIR